jgi:hypothetical protein
VFWLLGLFGSGWRLAVWLWEASRLGQAVFYFGEGGPVGGWHGEVFQGLVGVGCHERSLLWLLIVLDSVVVTNSSVGAGLTIPWVVCGHKKL